MEESNNPGRKVVAGIWNLEGTSNQQRILQDALKLSDFPFERLLPALAKEGKQTIKVSWDDLSRYTETSANGDSDALDETGKEISLITREVEGRKRVLGLFYLPPYSEIVLDNSLEYDESLAHEVFFAEGAHAVDYYYLDNKMRLAIWNALHAGNINDLSESTIVTETGDLSHGHSWFDGPAGYSTWVGENFMEAFTKAFAPSVPVTITMTHATSPEAAKVVRDTLLGVEDNTNVTPPQPDDNNDNFIAALIAALKRFLSSKNCPLYLKIAATNWLNSKNSR